MTDFFEGFDTLGELVQALQKYDRGLRPHVVGGKLELLERGHDGFSRFVTVPIRGDTSTHGERDHFLKQH